MTRWAKIWLTTAVGFAGYLGFAYSLPRWLSLPDQRAWILFGALAVIGLGAWLFTAIFLSKRQPAPPPPSDPLLLEMDAALTQTEQRLVAARVARGAVLHKLPAVFVLGPRQHHKTSCVIRSGVHAELLAGDVLRGAQVVPTQTINTWFAGQAVVAEVGFDVAQAPERFGRFLARFQPARLANALASGEQAPRVALVCYSCEALRAPGARDATLIAARELRGTLSTIAQNYGIRLPVYVLFTKADVVPGFKEFARRFTADEVRDVLGATLPLTAELRAAEYADRASHAYRAELLTLFESLAARRVDVLAREDAAEYRTRAYQFPRELRKLEPLIGDFLVELARPSDLSTSPFIRGFYFSGVREVIVSDGGAPVVAASPAATHAGEEAGATALLGALPQPGVAPAKSLELPGSAIRREAQWVFLDRLLSQVVLNDAAALGVTRGGTRISFFRRAALGAAAAAVALLIVGQLNAFAANARLQRSVRRHSEAVMGLPATPVTEPALGELALLDSLGGSLDALSRYTWERAPVHLRWGLYQGDALYGTTHAAYFRHFRRLLLESTFATMGERLSDLSGTPPAGAQFFRAYDRLKAYLIVTGSASHATDALAAVLLADWPPAAPLDTAGRALALRQFQRYARELPRRNPYQTQLAADPAVIARARMVLKQAASDLRIYQAIIQTASDSVPGVDFNRDYRLAGVGALSVPHAIPGAFTRAGHVLVTDAIRDVRSYLDLESWVLPPDSATGSAPNEDALKRALEARYDSQFVDHWRGFVRTASVPGFGTTRDASQQLAVLAGAQSPIMQMFALVNEHTGVDSADIGRFFEPIRQLGAPRMTASPPDLIGAYLQQLTALSQQLQTVAQAPPAGQEQAIRDGHDKVSAGAQALTSVIGKLGHLKNDLQIEPLLNSPLQNARAVLDRDLRGATDAAARGPVEDAGKAFCESFSELSSRRPFSREVRAEWATPTDLAAVLAPNGSLSDVMQSGLREILVRQGRQFAPKPRAALHPELAALDFLNRLAKIQEALYPGTSEPQLQFTIEPVLLQTMPRVTISFGSQMADFDRGRPETLQKRNVVWRFATDRTISIVHPRDRRWSRQVPPEETTWAPLFFFNGGQWHNSGTNRWQFDYEFEAGLTIGFMIGMEGEVYELLQQTLFEPALTCPSRWARAAR